MMISLKNDILAHILFSSKKQRSSSQPMPAYSLPGVTYKGELSHKQRFGWAKRVCYISEHKLVIYKREQDSKPALVLRLGGYDVLAVQGETVGVIRLSQPGCVTHMLRANTQDAAERWIQVCMCIKQLVLISPRMYQGFKIQVSGTVMLWYQV